MPPEPVVAYKRGERPLPRGGRCRSQLQKTPQRGPAQEGSPNLKFQWVNVWQLHVRHRAVRNTG